MGIFDWLFGKKKTENIYNKVHNNSSQQRVNVSETEDVGIVTHYRGKPFTGICFDLYDNGKIRSEFEMLNGLKHGTGKDFDEYGNIESEYNHKDDLLTGSHKSFYKNGVLKRDIKYKNGMIVDCISYNKDGTQIVQNEQQKEITKKLMDHVNKEYGPE